MRSAIAIRHVAFEGLDSLERVLREHNYDVQYCDVGLDDVCRLALVDIDLLIVLGGPIGAYETDKYPFLLDELRLLERRLAAGCPTLGICLGAQLIAKALGARVYPGPAKEIGWYPILLTEQGLKAPIRHLGQGGVLFHWHGDTFDLPNGASLLASTRLVQNQAYSYGPNVLGLQFHPELQIKGFERWLVGHACELNAARIDLGSLRADTTRWVPDLQNRARAAFADWLGQIEVPRDQKLSIPRDFPEAR